MSVNRIPARVNAWCGRERESLLEAFTGTLASDEVEKLRVALTVALFDGLTIGLHESVLSDPQPAEGAGDEG